MVRFIWKNATYIPMGEGTHYCPNCGGTLVKCLHYYGTPNEAVSYCYRCKVFYEIRPVAIEGDTNDWEPYSNRVCVR